MSQKVRPSIYPSIKTILSLGILLFLSIPVIAEPVETFPELLEKIQEHREMIKDVSGTINYGYDENDPLEILNHFVYVDGKWLLCSEITRADRTYNAYLQKHTINLVTDIDYTQFAADSIEFSYNPKSRSAFLLKSDPNEDSPFKHMTTSEGDQMPFIGVDTFGWTRRKVEELYNDIQSSGENATVTPSFTMDENLLLLTIKYQDHFRDMHETLKLWFDPDKQYSIVRCHEGQIFDWHSKKSEIEMVAVGDPPVYFPRQVSSRLFHKSDDHENFCGENIILYENIKINSGLTKDDVNIKLPKDTKVYNSINDKCMITTVDNVTLDQILIGENDDLIETEVSQPPVTKTVLPPPPSRKPSIFMSFKLWGVVLGFFWLGLMTLLIVKYVTRDKRIILD